MKPVTLITGGSSGIGAATAASLLKQGHRVALTGRDADRLAEFAAVQDAGPSLGGALYAAHGTGPLPWTSLGVFVAVLVLAVVTGRTAFPASAAGDASADGPAPQEQQADALAATTRTSG